MQVDVTGPDDALVHCKQQVVKYIARKAIKKCKGVEMPWIHRKRNVLRYMRTRAKRSPQDMRLFMQLKYFDMMLLLRKAEHRNKIDLYFACMRLSLPLLAVESCTTYMLIFTEMLRYWDECSPAAVDLIRRYGFVLETPNGTFISMDFGMEKYVHLVRDTTGKI
jgi:hypothetical protein